MQSFSVIEYLAIGIANAFGKDKLNFSERILWVKENLKTLPQKVSNADEPEMAQAGLRSMKYFLTTGQLDGHMVGMDASASGTQIISSLMRDPQGLELTGVTSPNRGDVYTSIFKNFTQFLLQKGIEVDFSNLTRNTLKDVLMKYAYGAYNEPVDVLGKQIFDLFQQYIVTALPAVATYLNVFKEAQNASDETQIYTYRWSLPDGHESFSIPFSKTGETFQSCFKGAGVDGSNAYSTFVLSFFGQENDTRFIKNAANVIHSVDAFVVRELHRFMNYDRNIVIAWVDALSKEVNNKGESEGFGTPGECPSLVVFSALPTEEALKDLTHVYKTWLLSQATKMLEFIPTPLVTVHDEFKALPTHLDFVRAKYADVLKDLGYSKILEYIYRRITGRNLKFPHYMGDKLFNQAMSKSEYALS